MFNEGLTTHLLRHPFVSLPFKNSATFSFTTCNHLHHHLRRYLINTTFTNHLHISTFTNHHHLHKSGC
uniref:Uncharacterized protein n=1 Tax=Helianthus annuus TaxID=4232 RepID=A0A251TQS1_HELAN